MRGKSTAGKSKWVLILMLAAGIVVGGLLGTLAEGSAAFGWLNYGQSFGLDNPVVLDLGIFTVTLGFTVKITISGIIGMAIAAVVYRFL